MNPPNSSSTHPSLLSLSQRPSQITKEKNGRRINNIGRSIISDFLAKRAEGLKDISVVERNNLRLQLVNAGNEWVKPRNVYYYIAKMIKNNKLVEQSQYQNQLAKSKESSIRTFDTKKNAFTYPSRISTYSGNNSRGVVPNGGNANDEEDILWHKIDPQTRKCLRNIFQKTNMFPDDRDIKTLSILYNMPTQEISDYLEWLQLGVEKVSTGISTDHIEQIHRLFTSHPEASEKTQRIWASRIGLDFQEVRTYIGFLRKERGIQATGQRRSQSLQINTYLQLPSPISPTPPPVTPGNSYCSQLINEPSSSSPNNSISYPGAWMAERVENVVPNTDDSYPKPTNGVPDSNDIKYAPGFSKSRGHLKQDNVPKKLTTGLSNEKYSVQDVDTDDCSSLSDMEISSDSEDESPQTQHQVNTLDKHTNSDVGDDSIAMTSTVKSEETTSSDISEASSKNEPGPLPKTIDELIAFIDKYEEAIDFVLELANSVKNGKAIIPRS